MISPKRIVRSAWLSLAIASAGAPPTAALAQTTLNVSAAASLSETFNEIKRVFEGHHKGVTVRFNFAGSNQLALQVEQGAPVDVFASADERWMNYLHERKLLAEPARVFAHNRLVAITPRSKRSTITRLQQLTRSGIKVVVAAEAVPAGAYTRQALRNLALAPGFDRDYDTRVLANVVSEEETVKAVVAKIQLGEADAGFVYRSDVTPAVAPKVRVIAIPETFNADAIYPVAVVRQARSAELGKEFITLLLSAEGQRIAASHGMLPARPF